MAFPAKTDFVNGDPLTAAQMNEIGDNINYLQSYAIAASFLLMGA